jgi:L-asparaginase
MNLSKRSRLTTQPLTVHLLREGIMESEHICQAAVVDHRGRTLSMAGNNALTTFARSCLKPIQAIALSATGALDRFALTEADLAIICGSHQGTISQARQVFHILWRCDAEPSLLHCPVPAHHTSPLHHNCSGKHAGMIAVCQHQGWLTQSYCDRNHPVQELVLSLMAELLHLPPAEFIAAHDDCGAPTYCLELAQLAHFYALLTSDSHLHLTRIARAMVHHPDRVAGEGQFDTVLMHLTQGALLSKSGAEGLQCIGRMGEGLGLAIKVSDGTKRAKHAAAIHLLRQLGWITPAIAERLAEHFTVTGPYTRLDVTGELTWA